MGSRTDIKATVSKVPVLKEPAEGGWWVEREMSLKKLRGCGSRKDVASTLVGGMPLEEFQHILKDFL